jgi:hypothetical protein
MVAMNLIGAQPHLRREMCVGIPQNVPARERWNTVVLRS